jgi:hypothetical protein
MYESRTIKAVNVKQTSVSIPHDVVERVKAIARAEDRTFSNALVHLVRRALPPVEHRKTIAQR